MKIVQDLDSPLQDEGGQLAHGEHIHFCLPTMTHTRDSLGCVFALCA